MKKKEVKTGKTYSELFYLFMLFNHKIILLGACKITKYKYIANMFLF